MNLQKTIDSLSIQDLEERGSLKWTGFPGTIGAWIAESDFELAPAIEKAVIAATKKGVLGYLPWSEEQHLATVVSGYLGRKYNWDIPESAVRTMGDVLRAYEIMIDELLEPGRKVVVPTPAYHPFLEIPPLHGREVVQVPMLLDESGIWRLDFPAIEFALQGGGLFVLCNPHNPLGRIYTREELERLAEVIDSTGSLTFSDEIHAPLIYGDARHIPYASLSKKTAEHTITALSASKAFNVPGLKCAQAVLLNPKHQEVWDALGYFGTRGASNLGVVANIAAFESGDSWLAEVLQYLDKNRQILAELVEEYLPGAVYHIPEATYLGWIDMRPLTDRIEFGDFLREECQISISSGEECGVAGEGFIRVNFAMPTRYLEQLVERIGRLHSEQKL